VERELPIGPGEKTAFGKVQSTMAVPMVCRHPKQLDPEYVQTHWRSEVVHGALERLWPTVQAWAIEYTGPGSPAQGRDVADDLYMPGPEDIEACIAQATDPTHLEAYRQRLLDLRNQREVDKAEPQRLDALIEERMAEVTALI
jgi:hypothetical protein